jgi:hypothetical protein
LVSQIRAQATEGMVSRDEAAQAEDLAVSEEAARILDLHAAVFGDEAGARLAKVVNAGVTGEQIEALGGVLGAPTALDAATPAGEEQSKRQEMLAAITGAAAKPLEPQNSGDESKPRASQWPELVKAHAAKHSVSKAEAVKAIDDLYPGLRAEYLEDAQGEGE